VLAMGLGPLASKTIRTSSSLSRSSIPLAEVFHAFFAATCKPVYTLVEKPDQKKILEAVHQIIARVQSYVPAIASSMNPSSTAIKSPCK